METKSNRLSPAAAAAVAPSLVLAVLLFREFGFPVYLVLPSALLIAWIIRKAVELKSGRLYACSAVFAVLLSAACVIGAKTEKSIPAQTAILSFFVLAVSLFFFTACIAGLILRHPLNPAKKAELKPAVVWAVCALILFLSWVPCLLVYYPGNFSPDSLVCIRSAVGSTPLSNQQPVFYILLMRPFLLLATAVGKSLNFGIALFLVFQAAAMAAMLGYFPCWLAKRRCPRWTFVLSMAYFVLNPVFAMYSVTMWKDVLFSALVLLYLLNLVDIVRSGGAWLERKRLFIWFLALNVLIAFMRNNGYYIIFVTLAVLLIIYRKKWKRLLPAFASLLLVIPVVQGPVYRLCGVTPSPFAESVGIPLQQIGLTVKEGGTLTQDQREFLNRLMPLDAMKQAYTPHSSDGIKFNKQFNNAFLEKNKAKFLKVWFSVMGANRKAYGEAYLMETLGYWHVGTTYWVLHYGIESGLGAKEYGLAMTGLWGLNQNSGSIQRTFQAFQNSVPILSLLVNIGFLFWSAVFCAMMLMLRKQWKMLVPLLPLFVLWGTLMLATPTFCEFRYMFAFAAAFPLFVVSSFPVKGTPAPEPGRSAEKARGPRPAQTPAPPVGRPAHPAGKARQTGVSAKT